jgi:pyridoxal phosphate-dependent aminotransferase EpsN
LHLALVVHGVQPGDEVILPTLAPAWLAGVVRGLGAQPVLVDCEPRAWTVDPAIVAEALSARRRAGGRVAAVIASHLLGQCADMDSLRRVCDLAAVPLIEDASHALGGDYRGRSPGVTGACGIYAMGEETGARGVGSVLVSTNATLAHGVRELAARLTDRDLAWADTVEGHRMMLDDAEAERVHRTVEGLADRVQLRRALHDRYVERCAKWPGIVFQSEMPWGRHVRWRSCLRLKSETTSCQRDAMISHLAAHGVHATALWRPLHLDPHYSESPRFLTGSAELLHAQVLCLPMDHRMHDRDVDRYTDVMAQYWFGRARQADR